MEEVILVDDFSDMDHLMLPLEKYVAQLGKVRIIRAKKREGETWVNQHNTNMISFLEFVIK